ncbi:Calcyphosin-like protein isoform X1 [Aphelenchoides fujianensis]|nr:Calcyphosin-like protein isoform X1 [Aphelenchoides fujianensis]
MSLRSPFGRSSAVRRAKRLLIALLFPAVGQTRNSNLAGRVREMADFPLPINVSSCFSTLGQTNLLNLVPSATTTEEIADKGRQEFRKTRASAERLRYACIGTGVSKLKSFLRHLQRHPNISLNELWQLVGKLAVHFTDDDLDRLIAEYSRNGRVDTRKLIDDVQVPLSPHRRQLLEQIFAKISGGKEAVDTRTFQRAFCFKNARDYVSGKKSEQQVVAEFRRDFNLDEHEAEANGEAGEVTKEDFINYFSAISFGSHSDAYFDLFMRQTWNF